MSEIEAGIVTDDIGALTRFYGAAFGLVVEAVFSFPQGEVRRLRGGAARLKLFQPATAPAPRGVAPFGGEAGFRYAALLVDDAEAAVAAVQAAGGTVITPVTHHRPGACFALITDPQGNTWELLQEGIEP
jgi:predicted enzyme related to lactoylglutathione lyase